MQDNSISGKPDKIMPGIVWVQQLLHLVWLLHNVCTVMQLLWCPGDQWTVLEWAMTGSTIPEVFITICQFITLSICCLSPMPDNSLVVFCIQYHEVDVQSKYTCGRTRLMLQHTLAVAVSNIREVYELFYNSVLLYNTESRSSDHLPQEWIQVLILSCLKAIITSSLTNNTHS